jgi:hypothetical protein
MKKKFDKLDRQYVIEEVERIFDTKLTRVGRRRIYLKSTQSARFIVLGGIEDWHGIPDDVIEDIESFDDIHLVLAIKKQETIKIYHCDMTVFLENLEKLNRPGNDKFAFNIDEYREYARIRKATAVTLDLLVEINYTAGDRKITETKDNLKKLLDRLSPEERSRLISKYKQGNL